MHWSQWVAWLPPHFSVSRRMFFSPLHRGNTTVSQPATLEYVFHGRFASTIIAHCFQIRNRILIPKGFILALYFLNYQIHLFFSAPTEFVGAEFPGDKLYAAFSLLISHFIVQKIRACYTPNFNAHKKLVHRKMKQPHAAIPFVSSFFSFKTLHFPPSQMTSMYCVAAGRGRSGIKHIYWRAEKVFFILTFWEHPQRFYLYSFIPATFYWLLPQTRILFFCNTSVKQLFYFFISYQKPLLQDGDLF